MKRKILALFTVFAMLLTVTGCSKDGIDMLKEMKKVSSWEAMNTKVNVGTELTAGDAKMKLSATVEGYMVQAPLQAEMMLTFNNLEVIDQGKSMKMNLSPVKMYMEGTKVYMSTSYYKEIAGLTGEDAVQEIGKIVDLSKEYIAFDMASTFEELGLQVEELTSKTSDYYTWLEGMQTEVPIVKKDNQYTVSLNEDQIVELICSVVKEYLGSPAGKTQIVALMQKVDPNADALTVSQQVEEMIMGVETLLSEENKATIKSYIPGTTAKVAYTFEENSYKADCEVNLKALIMEEAIELKMTEQVVAEKAEKKTIKMPESVATYDYKEFIMTAISGLQLSAHVDEADVIVKDGITYVPVRKTATSAGVQVSYDSAAKTVCLEYEGQKMPIKTTNYNGTAYMSTQDAASYGIVVIIE